MVTNPLPSPAVRVPDGLPAVVAVSQLIWRALGPRAPRPPQILSAWAGLAGPAPTNRVVLAHYGLAEQTLTGWRRTVQHAGAALELPWLLAAELTRPSCPGEDHQARRRWAQLFTLPIPIRLPARTVSPTERGLVKIAVRILSALGPLPVDELAAAMSRTRPPTGRTRTVTASQLAALAWTAEPLSIDPRDRMCWLTHPHPAYPPDLRLLALAAASGRTGHNRPEMVELLTATGYGASIEPTLAKHPLLVHTARGHWNIRTSAAAPIASIR